MNSFTAPEGTGPYFRILAMKKTPSGTFYTQLTSSPSAVELGGTGGVTHNAQEAFSLDGEDIGAPSIAGSTTAVAEGSDYDIQGAGTGIGGTSDQFHFASTPVDGDFDVRVQVTGVTAGTTPSFGIMARTSLDADSENVFVGSDSISGGTVTLSHRDASGAASVVADETAASDEWLRLVRESDAYTAYVSGDGVNWSEVSRTFGTSDTVYVGLAVTSQDAANAASVSFRNMAIIEPQPSTYPGTDIGAPDVLGTTTEVIRDSAYDLLAGGTGMTGTQDQLQFGATELDGDFDISARIATVTSDLTTAEFGLMARESLDPDSSAVFFGTTASDGAGFILKHRDSTSASSTTVSLGGSNANAAGNTWIRLARVGDTITAYTSTNGDTWTEVDQFTSSLPTTLNIGLSAAGGASDGKVTVEFRDLHNNGDKQGG